MRILSRLTIVLVLAVAALAATASIALASGRLVYSDEFNGPFDTTTWATVTPWNTHTDTIQTSYYDPSNVSLVNGSLRITSKNQASNGYAYTSAFLTSSARPKFSYGYFEIRAKLPKGPGIWPAFWLTNDSTLEIDGLEMLGDRPSRIYQTLHENDSQIYQGVKNGPDYSADFHTYGIDWQPGYVKWYIDGVCTASYTHAMPADPLYICLNTAVGGTWPGAPTPATTFPVNYDIDYVHVYDRMPASAAVSAAPAVKATALAATPSPVDQAATVGQRGPRAATVGDAAESVAPSRRIASLAEGVVRPVSDGGGFPSVALDVPTSCAGCAWARASASAALSGVDHVEMKLDSGAWVNTTLLSTAQRGHHVVYARAFDIAGRERDTVRTFDVIPTDTPMATIVRALVSYQARHAQ